MSAEPDLTKVTMHFHFNGWNPRFWLTQHGVERRDGAGCDLYVRIGAVVIGVPHLFEPGKCLKALAGVNRKLIESLETTRFQHTGKFS